VGGARVGDIVPIRVLVASLNSSSVILVVAVCGCVRVGLWSSP